jgi:hypothetical protein
LNEKYISRDNLELVIEGLKVGMTPNWEENDKSAVGYIENRPFYTEYGVIVDNYSGSGKHPRCNFVVGNTYDVIWNGRTYKGLVCHTDGEYNFIGGDGYPFYIDDDAGDGFYINPESGFTVSILGDIFHQLDEKYIPNSIARVNDVVSAMDETVEIVNQTVTKKMDANNPVGTGSFSMNRKQNTVVGKYSHAEGYSATASGEASHAEGYATTADGHGSHAEGISTVAYASYSHAEGVGVNASSYASHAEGLYTTTSGNASHAEGSYTIASGDYSHTEGYHTTARADVQHVQGQYNILDMIGEGAENGKYAHIVGNGTSESSRTNAHTLDWKGVGWYQGGLQVGGNAQDDGAKNVLLEGDAIPVPETAETGQILSVKTVDTNGRPTEWCAVDAPNSGGSAGFVAQSTAPEDTSVLWIDIDDDSKDEFQKAVNAALTQAKESGEFDGEPGKDGVVPVVGATVGQTVKISAVDENGVPTAWESVDFPSGGGSGSVAVQEIISQGTLDFSTANKSNELPVTMEKLREYKLFGISLDPSVSTNQQFFFGKTTGSPYYGCNGVKAITLVCEWLDDAKTVLNITASGFYMNEPFTMGYMQYQIFRGCNNPLGFPSVGTENMVTIKFSVAQTSEVPYCVWGVIK